MTSTVSTRPAHTLPLSTLEQGTQITHKLLKAAAKWRRWADEAADTPRSKARHFFCLRMQERMRKNMYENLVLLRHIMGWETCASN